VLAEPEEMDDAKRSKDAGILLKHEPGNELRSVADGLKTTLGPNTWPIIRDLVDDIITVTEYDILRATKLIWERLKVCIEPSAGVGVAVALGEEFQRKYCEGEQEGKVQKVGIVLCGGNVDVVKISRLMESFGI
jgi:threonine dehydratase